MNLTGQQVAPKAGKPKRNKAHMARVATLPCVICARHPVQVHHCIHGRYSQARAPDEMTIPLCVDCHNELHADKAEWEEANGPDHGFLPEVRRQLNIAMEDEILGDWF